MYLGKPYDRDRLIPEKHTSYRESDGSLNPYNDEVSKTKSKRTERSERRHPSNSSRDRRTRDEDEVSCGNSFN